MKATIEIDATPQEMREFMGLPDVHDVQKEVVDKVREKMLAAIESNDMSDLMKLYMPVPDQINGLESMQSAMWDAMTQGLSSATKPVKKKSA